MIRIIVAVSENNIIGRDNKLIWNLPSDLERFRDLTTNSVVVMGRKTWESIPKKYKPLPNRVNIVVSRDREYRAEGATMMRSLKEIHLVDSLSAVDTFIIGGEEIYRQSLEFADQLDVTLVHHTFTGDVRFPWVDTEEWVSRDRQFYPRDDKNEYDYSFVTYNRKHE